MQIFTTLVELYESEPAKWVLLVIYKLIQILTSEKYSAQYRILYRNLIYLLRGLKTPFNLLRHQAIDMGRIQLKVKLGLEISHNRKEPQFYISRIGALQRIIHSPEISRALQSK